MRSENWHIKYLQDTLVLAPRDTHRISLCLNSLSVKLFVLFEQILEETGTLGSAVVGRAVCYLSLCLCHWGIPGIFFSVAHDPGMGNDREPPSNICTHWNLPKLEVNLDFEVLIMRIFISLFHDMNWGDFGLLHEWSQSLLSMAHVHTTGAEAIGELLLSRSRSDVINFILNIFMLDCKYTFIPPFSISSFLLASCSLV